MTNPPSATVSSPASLGSASASAKVGRVGGVGRAGRIVRVLVALAVCTVARGAAAGDQLSVTDLVRDADAVVLAAHTAKGVTVGQTIWRDPSSTTAMPVSLVSPLCVPNPAMLQQWMTSHPRHSGRATWKKTLKALKAGEVVSQLVFLRARDGVLKPICETEVLLGWGFSTDDRYEAQVVAATTATAQRTSAAAAVAAPTPTAPLASTASTAPTAPTAQPPTPSASEPAEGQGCW